MKINFLKQLLFLGIMLSASVIFAQTVTGTVTGDDGPLPGVTILEKGTTNGATTDFDGNYSIDVGSDAILVFSFIGFTSQEVAVNSQSVINVQLAVDANELDEVVIIGYGQTTVRDATGSVETVKAESFNKGVTSSPNELLQGRVSGVQVTQASGEPGGGSSIRIRGVGSPRAGNSPLIVVDGVPISNAVEAAGGADFGFGTSTPRNPLAFINSNDIESMTVLKDASATAIYGSRAANGVILITTKKGKRGKSKVDYSSSFSVSEIRNSPDMLSGPAHSALTTQLGGTPAGNANVDGIDEITQTGFSQTHNVSLTAGNENATYRASLGYQDIEGIVKESGQEKFSGTFNSKFRFFEDDRLRLTTNLIVSHTNDQFAPIGNNSDFKGSLVGAALQWNPTIDLFNSDGTFNQFSDSNPNPLAFLQFVNDKAENSRILGSVAVEFDIVEDLIYKFQLGFDRFESVRRASVSPDFNLQGNNGAASVNNDYAFSKTFTHTLNYKKEFSEDFRFDGLLGYEAVINTRRGDFTLARGFSVDPGNLADFLAAGTERPEVSSYNDPTDDLQSYFARVNFSFLDKYLLTVNFRADGSSKFGTNNEYGYFPSAAFAWKLSEEDFIPEVFDNLKLRIGYGEVGNSSFPAGASQTQFEFINGLAVPFNFANPNLQWEVSTSYNAGIDFSFSNSRFSGSIDYFRKETEDLLFQREAIQPAPATRFWDNLPGTVVNTGVEITLNADIISTEDFSWEFGTNISFLDNTLEDFPFGDNDFLVGTTSGQGGGAPVQRIANNQPLFAFYLPIFTGYDGTGLPTYQDLNGDGTGDSSTDRTFVGDPNPDILVGIRSFMKYKDWDLTINMNGAYGHEIFNNTASAITEVRSAFPARNVSSNFDVANINVGAANAASTLYLESGDFLRLSNVTLGYNINTNSEVLSNLRVTFTGQNLFVITPYSGFDPEVNTVKFNDDGIPSFGIEYAPYPAARTFSLGLSASF
jgi:iron complex outermembrane receptor protein